MYLIVIQDNKDAYIEIVEHTPDYLLTGKNWRALLPLDTVEEVKQAIDLLKLNIIDNDNSIILGKSKDTR